MYSPFWFYIFIGVFSWVFLTDGIDHMVIGAYFDAVFSFGVCIILAILLWRHETAE